MYLVLEIKLISGVSIWHPNLGSCFTIYTVKIADLYPTDILLDISFPVRGGTLAGMEKL